MKNPVRVIVACCAVAVAVIGSLAMNCFLNNEKQQANPATVSSSEKTEHKVHIKVKAFGTETNEETTFKW